MNDTSTDVASRARQHHEGLTPEQRWRIASDMFEVARRIVESSLPSGLTTSEKRSAVIERFYGDAFSHCYAPSTRHRED